MTPAQLRKAQRKLEKDREILDREIAAKARNDAWKRTPRAERKAAGVAASPFGLVKSIGIKVPKGGLKIAVITDVQAKKGVRLDHLTWCGEYLARKQPDVIVIIGDFGDFPSMSDYDSDAYKVAMGYTYQTDLDYFHIAMNLLMDPINRVPGYKPHLEFIDGNHEDRIDRVVLTNPKMEGMMSLADLRLEEYGWREHKFLEPIDIGGVAFTHYFPSGVMGRAITSARMILNKYHQSGFAGHLQGREIAYSRRADGSNMTAIISGSFYQHDEKYLSPFTNKHWRGMYMLHEVEGGSFDEMAVSINFLKKKFKQHRKR